MWTRTWWDRGLLALAAGAFGLSAVSLWWTVPGIGAAFAAGVRMERVREAVALLAALVTAGALVTVVAPDLAVQATSVVSVLVCAGMAPWMVGRFWRQSQDWCGPGGSGPNGPSTSSGWWPSGRGCANAPGSRRTCTTRWATT